MTTAKLERILSAHNVPYRIQDGKILADSMESGKELFEVMIDVTNWTLCRLCAWLGY